MPRWLLLNFHNSVNICFRVCFGRKHTCEWLDMTVFVLKNRSRGVCVYFVLLEIIRALNLLPKSNFFEEKAALSKASAPTLRLLWGFQTLCQCGGKTFLWSGWLFGDGRFVYYFFYKLTYSFSPLECQCWLWVSTFYCVFFFSIFFLHFCFSQMKLDLD